MTLGSNDYIMFRDGVRDDSPLIAKYADCASGEIRLYSSDRYLLVDFVSDTSEPGDGFALDYETVESSKATKWVLHILVFFISIHIENVCLASCTRHVYIRVLPILIRISVFIICGYIFNKILWIDHRSVSLYVAPDSNYSCPEKGWCMKVKSLEFATRPKGYLGPNGILHIGEAGKSTNLTFCIRSS